ncbi:Desmethyl-deoxy-podophyllotoxin synthase [Linum grandiflorum]
MEEFLIIIILFIITIITLLIKPILTKTKTTPSSSPQLPPGPTKLPIIGNLHQLAAGKSHPHRRLAELAKQYGPLMHLTLGETSNVVVSSPEVAEQIMKTHDLHFATRPYLPSTAAIFYGGRDVAFGAYSEYWKQMRKICTVELLGPHRVKQLRPVREEEVGELVRLISSCEGTPVDLSRLLTSVGNAITSRAAFGKAKTLEEAFTPVMNKTVKVLGGLSIGDIFPSNKLLRIISGTERQLKKLHREADAILEGIIDEHLQRRSERSSGADDGDQDLVDVLLNFTEKKDLGFPFTNLEIKAVILDLFLAGGDSSSNTVVWAMSELMKNPSAMQKAQNEVRQIFDEQGKVDEDGLHKLNYLPLIIKETFRMHLAAPLLIPRECRETVVIDGYLIPAKTRVHINGWAIGRDPNHWSDPDEFKPERFIDSCIDYKGHGFLLLPFGSGRRLCPGIQYGVAVIELLLASLLYHFDWELPEGMDELDMDEDFGAVVSRKNSLVLVPVPYHPT